MRTYLTGGTGFVGSNVAEVFAGFHGAQVHCPIRSTEPDTAVPFTWESLDLLDADDVRTSVRRAQPDAIVHCAILNDWDRIYRERGLAWNTYVGTTRTLAQAANDVGATFMVVSTDWVFDGEGGAFAEDTPPNPINFYGVLKMASELVALEVADRPAVARLAGVNGMPRGRPAPPRTQDRGFGFFVATVVERLRAGERFAVWTGPGTNAVATPSLASVSAEMMWRILERGLTGIFHCCGGEAISRMKLAQCTAEVFGLDPGLLDTAPPTDAFPAAVPRDSSLSAQATATAIDVTLPTVRQLLERFRLETQTGQLHPTMNW